MTMINEQLAAVFVEFKRLVDEYEPVLTTLDERSGDGDFGANLQGGVGAAADRGDGAGEEQAWVQLTTVFLDEVGGTSGPLLGLLFQNMQLAAQDAESLVDVVRVGTGEGLAAIQRVGEAEVGDRTLVDALAPAVEAAKQSAGLAAIVDAAVDGAVATQGLVARRGRASYVGERAIGYPDPGCVGVALLFIALGRAEGLDVNAALKRLLTSSK